MYEPRPGTGKNAPSFISKLLYMTFYGLLRMKQRLVTVVVNFILAFAAFLLPFVRDALGDGFSLHDTRLRGGSSFHMAYVDGRSMTELRFFNRIDIEELEINAYAVLSRPVQLHKE
jgi:hypothetical protein